MLREQSKKAKEMKQQQQMKKIWDEVDDGEQIDSDAEESQGNSQDGKDDKFGQDDESDGSDDILVKVDEDKRVKIQEPKVQEEKPFKPSKIKKKDIGKSRQLFDADGNVITDSIDALKASMNVVDEKQALKESKKVKEDFVDKVKSKLKKTKE